jgi:hypothetical protein
VTARRRGRRGSPATVLPYLIIAALALGTIVGLAARPPDPDIERTAAHVVIAGAPGLRWQDLDPERTPNLWRLADEGAVGSLSTRSAHRPTCPGDGWLTLGAGNWAADTTRPADASCLPMRVTIEPTGAAGAYLPGQEAVVRANRWNLPWGAVPGALAGAVECSTAIGAGGAVAAARVYGRVDRYEPRLPSDPDELQSLLERCELGIVDLGTVIGDGAVREESVRRVDTALGTVVASRPPSSLILVAGVADTSPDPRLHLVVGEGPGLGGGLLTSNTTRRTGYVQLVDLAPTALAALGRPLPEVRIAGHPAHPVPVRSGGLEDDLRRMVAVDEEAGRAEPVRGWFLIGVVVAHLALFAALVPTLRRPRPPPERDRGQLARQPHATGDGAARQSRPPRRTVAAVLLVAAAMALPAALVTGGLPWWRAGPSEMVFLVSWLGVTAALTAALVAPSRLFARTLALVAAGAALPAGAVAIDLLTGARLQLNSVIGYSAHDGDRFSGVGPVAAGLLIAGTLLAAGALAQRVQRRWRPVVFAAPGAGAVVLLGSAYLGGEAGGAVAMTAGVCLAAALCTGGWLTVTRIAWAAAAGLAVTVAVALADLQRPVEQRGGLGRLFTELSDGTAGFGLQRVSLTNWESLASSPMNALAIGAGLFMWLVLLRPSGGLKRLFGIYPAMRAAMVGVVAASVLGGVLTGQALIVAGAAAGVVLPLLTLAALRVREHPLRARATAAAVPDSRAAVLW